MQAAAAAVFLDARRASRSESKCRALRAGARLKPFIEFIRIDFQPIHLVESLGVRKLVPVVSKISPPFDFGYSNPLDVGSDGVRTSIRQHSMSVLIEMG